ncbi:MAG: enoyl-CoA hydratase-related protein [Bacteroidales bacterium]
MIQYKYIIESSEAHVGTITLNRPEVHNALHIEMIREISCAFRRLSKKRDLRLISIRSNGKNFSAGADLNWMKKGLEQSKKKLTSESEELAKLFNDIYTSPKVTLAVAKGKVMGGANGIIAAADISVAANDTSFTFSEVKLGLIPATISPYIVARTGKSAAREWMLTGRQIDAREAYERGLINQLVLNDDTDEYVQQLQKQLLRNGPRAMKGIKKMFRNSDLQGDPDNQIKATAKLIAKYRISEEGQEGIQAFLKKRNPGWIDE